MNKNAQNPTSQKTETQHKNFFSLQARRLAEFFEGLNSSLVHSAEKLCSW